MNRQRIEPLFVPRSIQRSRWAAWLWLREFVNYDDARRLARWLP